ncbi:MAG: hypothetical protein OXS28_04690 [Gammaproteobacteria bacterium]|nr:hypothetical protein [Gammaproteobacteria bacterium]
MRLKRLNIQTLPGIEPGFIFEPPGAGINIVTGPNAIGKSSLERALGYLLQGANSKDPIALSLEVELVSGDTTWRVLRNGSQVAWYRGADAADRPPLPGALQKDLYRLSVEHLLNHDDPHDKDLAQSLRNSLHGGFDLDTLRLELGSRFAQNDEKNLHTAQQALREAEAYLDTLERQEQEELPRLNREIEAAGDAQERLQRLQQGLDLHRAVEAEKSCAQELEAYPPGMDRLRGDEQELLAGLEEKTTAQQDKLREQERRLHGARAALEKIGFVQSRPDPRRLDTMELRLQQLGQKLERRNNAQAALTEAEAALDNARSHFNGAGEPPRLDAQSLERAEAIAAPLLKAEARRDTLQPKLEQAGNPPDETEINKLYEASGALREWQAATAAETGDRPATSGRSLRIALWLVLAASALAAGLAWLQQALPAMAAALAAVGAAVWGLFWVRRPGTGSSADAARQRFDRTGLAGPPDWSRAAVDEYLRSGVEKPYNALLLQRERAAQAGDIRAELKKIEAEIASLLDRKQEAAAQLGFDPKWPSVKPDIFLQHCRQLAEAESRHSRAQAGVEAVQRDIAQDVVGVREFLAPWCSDYAAVPEGDGENGDEDLEIHRLQVLFQELKQRAQSAKEAQGDITRAEETIRSIEREIDDNRADIGKLFTGCGIETEHRRELDRRLGLLDEWKAKQEALHGAQVEEKRIRSLLESHPEITRDVDAGKPAKVQTELAVASARAGAHTELVRRQTEITTRLKDAGADHKLGRARAAADSARAALQDKREEAWLFEATEVLLDDVEQTYQAEHVPPTLKRAQDLFRAITRGAFDLQLEKDGRFTARDLRQSAQRDLEQLSSGTRMQLLLALRLAWIEAQEQGGETLPLFLDEALTTSDEDRFAVMASSLEQLAVDGNRQIFYLSARRHECALWKQATGNEPPVIDLAETRFPREAHPSQDYDIVLPPSVPSPEGRDPETYASVLGVPLVNPRLEPGAVHLFYLLRDDLNLLYELIEEWHITSLGQLEALLGSDAGSKAVTETGLGDRLRQRCGVVRAWNALWRRGRGRPVDRIALEQSGIVSSIFMDRVAALAETVSQDGKALVRALSAGQVSGFRTGKLEELERWLAEEGYTDQEEILTGEERRRLTLQQAMSDTGADVDDINRTITWLESASP